MSSVVTFTLIILLFAIHSIAAAKILSKKTSVFENDGMYTTRMVAVVYGDYDRFVDRMSDVHNYIDMGVPYLVAVRVISKSPKRWVVWTHMYSFPMRAKYYTHVNIQRGSKKTKAYFKLLSTRGRYEVDHDYEHLSGYTTVHKIPNQKNKYRVNTVTNVKFKPSIIEFEGFIKGKLKHQVEGALRAFSN